MSLTFIAVLSLIAWGYLFFLRDGFWRADIFLNDDPAPTQWPSVAVIIPARNEAATIAKAVEAHLHCDYPGDFSVFVVDDQSTDDTRNAAMRPTGADERKAIVKSGEAPPAGWSGKLWALQQGVEQTSQAEYFLFADADIVLSRSALRCMVAKAERGFLSLTSLMARLDARAGWGVFLIPAFIYFFQKLYPFAAANDPNDPRAAAAGGCMLVRRRDLEAIGGLQNIRGAMIDDCSLAQAIKDRTPTTKIWIGLARNEVVSLRNNKLLSSIWNMVARTAYAQLQYSPLLLTGCMIGMTLIFLSPPLIVLTIFHHWNFTATILAMMAWGLMAFSYLPTLKLYDRPPWEAAAMPAAAAFYMAMTISSALRYSAGEGGVWKGRADPKQRTTQVPAQDDAHLHSP